MKKTMQFLAHLISFLLVGSVGILFSFSFVPDRAFFIIFALCLLVSPFLALCRTAKFVDVLFLIITLFSFSGGTLGAKAIGGEIAAYSVLSLGAILLARIVIVRQLPIETPEISHLTLRGMRNSRARRTILLKQSFSFFFKNAGFFAGILSVYIFFLSNDVSLSAVWSAAFISVCIGLFGNLLYISLGAPDVSLLFVHPKKSKYVFISLLSFILLLILIYIYFGSLSPDPVLTNARIAVQTVITPGLFAAFAGYLSGLLAGFILSFLGTRFFFTLTRGVQLVPASLFSVILLSILPDYSFTLVLSVLIPLAFIAANAMLESRLSIRPFRDLPIKSQKKLITVPLFHLANLAALPRILLSGFFASILMNVVSGGILCSLPDATRTFAAVMLAVIICITLILCFLTKEARHHE